LQRNQSHRGTFFLRVYENRSHLHTSNHQLHAPVVVLLSATAPPICNRRIEQQRRRCTIHHGIIVHTPKNATATPSSPCTCGSTPPCRSSQCHHASLHLSRRTSPWQPPHQNQQPPLPSPCAKQQHSTHLDSHHKPPRMSHKQICNNETPWTSPKPWQRRMQLQSRLKQPIMAAEAPAHANLHLHHAHGEEKNLGWRKEDEQVQGSRIWNPK